MTGDDERPRYIYEVSYATKSGKVETGYCERRGDMGSDGTYRIRWIYSHADLVAKYGGASKSQQTRIERLLDSIPFEQKADYCYTDHEQQLVRGSVFRRMKTEEIEPNYRLSFADDTLEALDGVHCNIHSVRLSGRPRRKPLRNDSRVDPESSTSESEQEEAEDDDEEEDAEDNTATTDREEEKADAADAKTRRHSARLAALGSRTEGRQAQPKLRPTTRSQARATGRPPRASATTSMSPSLSSLIRSAKSAARPAKAAVVAPDEKCESGESDERQREHQTRTPDRLHARSDIDSEEDSPSALEDSSHTFAPLPGSPGGSTETQDDDDDDVEILEHKRAHPMHSSSGAHALDPPLPRIRSAAKSLIVEVSGVANPQSERKSVPETLQPPESRQNVPREISRSRLSLSSEDELQTDHTQTKERKRGREESDVGHEEAKGDDGEDDAGGQLGFWVVRNSESPRTKKAKAVDSRDAEKEYAEAEEEEETKDVSEKEDDEEEEEGKTSGDKRCREDSRKSIGRKINVHREMSPEVAEFRDALCARPSRFYGTSYGRRILDLIRSCARFGLDGAASRHVRAFFFENDEGPCIREWTRTALDVPEKGQCVLCASTRHLTYHVSMTLGAQALSGKVGAECFSRLVALSDVIASIADALARFPEEAPNIGAAMRGIEANMRTLLRVHVARASRA